MSDFPGISHEDIQIIKAIMSSYYGDRFSQNFHQGSITEETFNWVAKLLAETKNCSQWYDAVPNPEDLLMPAKNLKKWAYRLVRESGKPFLRNDPDVKLGCKNAAARSIKSSIFYTLNM